MDSLPTSFFALAGLLLGLLAACAAVIAREPRRGAVLTAIFAALANAYLLKNKFAAGGGPSICNVNTVVNCDVVNASAASEMFGVPITVFGLAFYAGLAIAGILAGATPREAEPERARFDQLNVLFAVVNLVFSAYLAYQSKLIGAVCLVCVSIYLANVLLLASGWLALRHRAADMNTLITLGTTAAFSYSLPVTVTPGLFPADVREVYYEAVGVILTLILVGRLLEARAKAGTGEAIRALLELQARTAHVERAGVQVEIVGGHSRRPGLGRGDRPEPELQPVADGLG